MRPPLYNFVAVQSAVYDGRTVWIAPDLLDAEALTAQGLAATCKVGGARRWTEACSAALAEARRVIVCYRHDEPDALTGKRIGHERARWIYLSLRDAGVEHISFRRSSSASVAAHLRDGHVLDELVTDPPVGGRPDWPALELFDIWRDGEVTEERQAGGPWQPVDLASIIRGLESGEVTAPVPTLLSRTDGRSLLYRGEVHSIAAEPESAKGWIACEACAQVLNAGGRALYLDFEEPRPFSVVSRPLALGVARDAMIERFDYVHPPGVPKDALANLPLDDYALVVIDGVTEAMALMGLNPDKGDDVAKFLHAFAVPLAQRGAAVLLIDHVVKSKTERGRWPIGSQHKLAEVAVQFIVDVIKAPTRTSAGEVHLKLAKDRHGYLGRRGERIARVQIEPRENGSIVAVTLTKPGPSSVKTAVEPGEPSPQKLVEVSRAIEQAQTPPNAKELRKLVKGNARATDEAAEWLLANGYTDTPVGKRWRRWTSVKRYRMS